ncbi:MAG: hypothetical protein WBP29_00030 [Candidatus Zixiibacteriota bacterium]
MANVQVNRTGFAIDVGCPGCGGILTLQDDFSVVRCEHCSSVLRVYMPDLPPAYLVKSKLAPMQVRFHLDKHLRESSRALTPPELQIDGVYQPYWKIDSLILRMRNRIDTRIVTSEYSEAQDSEEVQELKQEISLTPHPITVSATPTNELYPYSLGLRTDYLKMRPFAANTAGDFELNNAETTVVHAYTQAEKVVQKLADSSNLTNKRNYSKLFGLRASLVYFPYFKCVYREAGREVAVAVDAVSGRVVGEVEVQEITEKHSAAPTQQFGSLNIDFHRCGNCGEDLPARNSFIYSCRNCHSLTILEKNPAFDLVIEQTDTKVSDRDMLLPFWLIRCDDNTMAAARRALGAPAPIDALAVPAFRITNFEALYRLTSRLTLALPKIPQSRNGEIEGDVAPANVSLQEALIVCQAALARGELKRNPAALPNLDFQALKASLLLIPFHAESYFLVDSVLSAITVERRAISALV